jgi:hypothetical protein
MQVKASTLYQADFSDKYDSFVIRVTTCCLHRIIIKALSALLPPSSTMISVEEENICRCGGEERADKPKQFGAVVHHLKHGIVKSIKIS